MEKKNVIVITITGTYKNASYFYFAGITTAEIIEQLNASGIYNIISIIEKA